MFDHFCVSFAQEVQLYSLHRKCNCRDYSDCAGDTSYLRRSKKTQRQTACSNDEPADAAAQSLGALGSESWTTSMIFHGFIIGYHHVPYQKMADVYSMVSATQEISNGPGARPGLKGCADVS